MHLTPYPLIVGSPDQCMIRLPGFYRTPSTLFETNYHAIEHRFEQPISQKENNLFKKRRRSLLSKDYALYAIAIDHDEAAVATPITLIFTTL